MSVGQCTVVALEHHADDAAAMLKYESLYECAKHAPGRRAMQGRGTVYAIALPVSGVRAVVRHNQHGGLLASITGDLFVAPTRAPYEMLIARQLRAAGVRTPDVLMFGVSPKNARLQRSDVVTREIEGGRDLSHYMRADEEPAVRAAAWSAARELVKSLNAAGARHHDLNVKNILIAEGTTGLEAWVLDVDRIVFGEPDSPRIQKGNIARLLRSARKWRNTFGSHFDESELAGLD